MTKTELDVLLRELDATAALHRSGGFEHDARPLERELAEANEKVRQLEEQLRLSDVRIGFAHNAVKGI